MSKDEIMHVTSNHDDSLESIVGKFIPAPTPTAQMMWELFKKNPRIYEFGVEYIEDSKTGKCELVGLSMIPRQKPLVSFPETPKTKQVEDEKLIIFGWVVTILPELATWCATDNEKRLSVNKLVDKMHEFWVSQYKEGWSDREDDILGRLEAIVGPDQNSEKQPLQQPESSKAPNVPLSPQSPSDGSYEAQEKTIRTILSKHRVLTNDGWNDPNGFDCLVDDLLRLNKPKKE